MFKLESYIAPLLMGYIDKYVKLKQEDFQLSLWGGDAVLNKLDLRLDAIENALNLPITFKSGHIHELQIHVPWTRLGSEPVVITINTIECILKLRDSAQGEDDSSSSASSPQTARASSRTRAPRPKGEEDLPPGYLASLMNRVMHNVNLVVNNLILKFVEDDIVLSVNVKSLECYSVNKDWTRSFIELALPDLTLRKVVDVNDLTVCLDKRNASGKIETYQDPLLYRCSLTCRLLMIHDSLHAKFPTITKFNVLCEKLDLSLTDTQLPMYCRLMELCIAIYYGTLDLGSLETSAIDEPAATAKDIRDHIPVDIPGTPTEMPGEGGEGWVSWAWSYVPQILPAGEEDLLDENGKRKRQEPAVLSLGFYISKSKVSFKLTETVKESQFYASQKVNFVPCLMWEAEGINIETLMKGLLFFNVQCGMSYTRIVGVGDSLSGTKDLEETGRNPCFLESGTKISEPRQTDYLTNSLFDPGGFENQGMKPEFIFDPEVHMEYHTENYGRQKFGAMWMDYVYNMEEITSPDGSSRSSTHSQTNDEMDAKENSTIRFLFGPGEIIVSSSMFQRFHKFFHCMYDHEYEPYSKPKPEIVDETRLPPTEIEVEKMEVFIPTRTYHITLLQPRLVILAADLGKYDVRKQKVTSSRKSKKEKKESSAADRRHVHLPAIVLHADRLDYQMTTAMYPRKIVQNVSKMSTPSANLIHHCHLHTYYKVFGLEAGLSSKEAGSELSPVQNIIQPISSVLYLKTILFPVYWKNPLQPRLEIMCELPQFTVNVTKAQTMLLAHTALSWLDMNPNPSTLLGLSLMDDIFKSSGSSMSSHPVLEMSLAGMEMKYCKTDAALAYTGTLSAIQAMVVHRENSRDTITPILYGPLDTTYLYQKDWLEKKPETGTPNADLVTFTIQIPTKPNTPQAPGAVFVDVQGLVGSLDPKLNQWMEYSPRQLNVGKDTKTSGLVVDTTLVEATSPLKNTSQASQESNPTGTKSMSQSRTQTQTQGQEEQADPSGGNAQQDNSWSCKMAELFPLIKIIELQVTMHSWCAVFPSKHIELTEPSMNIPANISSLLSSGKLPDVIVVCCPSVHVNSTGHKHTSPIQEIPIKALEQSFGGEKLPWSIKLANASAYTILSSTSNHHVLRPATVSATVAVTTKYHPPTSDNITSMGVCLHTDMETISVGCSNPQVQLGYNLLMSNIKSMSSLLESYTIIQKLYTPKKGKGLSLGPSTAPSSTTHMLLGGTVEGGTVKMTSSSSPAENPELMVGTITETSETASCESSPVKEAAEESQSVKVSLWLQWTLLKFEAKLYHTDKNGIVCLATEAEDLTSAVDIQDVYSKIKCKVGALNMTHYVQTQDSWVRGSNEGIILSCNEHLSHNLQVASNKLWNAGSNRQGQFNADEIKPIDKSHGFLLFTFTRALRRNVKRKLIKAGLTEGEAKDKKVAEKGLVYLNEVCLSVQPCDVVLNCPAMSMLLNVFTTMSSATGSLVKTAGVAKGPSPAPAPRASLPWFTADVIPLIYINATKFRMFIPQFTQTEREGVRTPESSHRGAGSRAAHDICVLQVESLSLVPAADNPLPRVVVEKDVYRQALQAGITAQTGSEVEDRQYQADIAGLGLSSGVWREIVAGGRRTQTLSMDDLAQNPALEWNTLPRDESEIEEVKLVPIAAGFDLKIVAAPAVVYNPSTTTERSRPLLVCGYSLEVNATSDIDFFLSTSQVKLMNQIVITNILPLLSPFGGEGGVQGGTDGDEQSANDSGVESEPSTLNTTLSRPEITVSLQPKEPEGMTQKKTVTDVLQEWLSTPFEVLLTAGKISFMLHSFEEMSAGKGDTKFNNRKRSKSKSNMDVKNTDRGKSEEKNSPEYQMWPFVYSYFSQPYTLISCQRSSQKIELSCYDIILKGAKPGHVVTDEQRLIPDLSDFTVHWIETRAGKADSKTGVPPSLYTLTISDFLSKSVEMHLDVDRPLMLNGSISKTEQALSFLQLVSKQITIPLLATKSDRKKAPVTPTPKSSVPAYLEYLSILNSINLHTCQIVVNIEGVPDPSQPKLSFLTSDVRGALTFQCQNGGKVEFEVGGDLSIKDILVRTSYKDTGRPLIGPFPLHLDASVLWTDPEGQGLCPRILCFMDFGMVPAYFGQEHVLCVERLMSHFQDFIKTLHAASSERSVTPVKRPGSGNKRPSSKTVDQIFDETEDDLRTGDFSYIADESFDMLVQPQVGEIIFAMDYTVGHASMTWSYAHPRAVTQIKVTPVPFSLPQELDVRFIDEKLKVPCVLQYWDCLSRQYVDYAEFDLSENESSSVELARPPGVEGSVPAVSTLWRVLILHPDYRQGHEKIDTPKSDEAPVLGAADEEVSEEVGISPLVSPLTLAASLSVDSCLLPAHIPTIQLAVSAARINLHLASHLTHLGQETPACLEPFNLGVCASPDKEFAVINLQGPAVELRHFEMQKKAVAKLTGSMSCDVVEGRNLTSQTVGEISGVQANAVYHSKLGGPTCVVDCSINDVMMRMSQSVASTVGFAHMSWSQLNLKEQPTPIFNQFVICNDTRDVLRVGQVGTDENLQMRSREALPYSWRTQKGRQLLRFGLEGMKKLWSESVDISAIGTQVCAIGQDDSKVILMVTTKHLNMYKIQVVLSGQIKVASRLSQNVDVRLLTHKPQAREGHALLSAGKTLPSYTAHHDNVRAVKIRLTGSQMLWSQEIPVTGEKMKESRLVKIPLHEKSAGFIHVWCHIFTLSHRLGTENLVLLTPVFVVKTHLPSPLTMNIESPRMQSAHHVELIGQGEEQQLHTMAGDMTHSVTFQIGQQMRKSSPALSLSSGMIEQVDRKMLSSEAVKALVDNWEREAQNDWPYNHSPKFPERHRSTTFPNQDIIVPQTKKRPSTGNLNDVQLVQPDIDLQVNLSQRWAGFKTLLIEISPHWLLVNESSVGIILMEGADKQWNIPESKTLAPPDLKETFNIGMAHNNQLYLSDPLTLSQENNLERYLPFVEGLLYMEGSLDVPIKIDDGAGNVKMCYLTIHSTIKEDMRIVTVREKYKITSWINEAVALQCFSVPFTYDKYTLDHDAADIVDLEENSSVSLLTWTVAGTDKDEKSNSVTKHVQYVTFSLRNQSDVLTPGEDHSKLQMDGAEWSYPTRVRSSETGARHNFSLPIFQGEFCRTRACVMTSQSLKLMTYLTVSEEASPAMEIHNNCNLMLHFGQTLHGVTSPGSTVHEEAELVTDLPKLPPYSSCHYSFPSYNSRYPEVKPPERDIRLHLAGVTLESDETGKLYEGTLPWSQGIDVTSKYDIFVSIPDVCDVKVHIEEVGYTSHVYIDGISRAEVSAKEIRSRIKGKEMVKVESSTPKVKKSGRKRRNSNSSIAESVMTEATGISYVSNYDGNKSPGQRSNPKTATQLAITCNILCQNASFALVQESHKSSVLRETARVSIEDAGLIFCPYVNVSTQTYRRAHRNHRLQLLLGDLQIDNQAYSQGKYDFPVLLLRQDPYKSMEPVLGIDDVSQILDHVAQEGIAKITVELCSDFDNNGQISAENFDVQLKPLTVYGEDTFLRDFGFDILEIVEAISPLPDNKRSPSKESRAFPPEVNYKAQTLSAPIRLKQITIAPFGLLLSVHASVKLFIASDNTPLNFSKFERSSLFTSRVRLSEIIAMHYMTGAIVRAGLVVGSLEILGNPTGLLRGVVTGVLDLFRLPYQGLYQGPGGFLSGVSRGLGSFLTNISTSTIASITDFASSVSRNMDRLSLDPDHQARLEGARRNKPEGLSEGLKNGLTGFGISILGAVAGIADQPLQTFTRAPDPQSPTSTSRAATGFVSGVGKGLVGAVTKPIGGAAELVSQAGTGLLHGTGLKKMPLPRQEAQLSSWEDLPNTALKYSEKLYGSVPKSSVLINVSAAQMGSKSPVDVALLLTPEILFVVSRQEDVQLQAFAVSEVELKESSSEASLVHVMMKETHKDDGEWDSQVQNQDRVAEFVSGKKMTKSLSEVSLGQSVRHGRQCFDFAVSPVEKQLFLALFKLAKNKLSGTGFPAL